MSIASLKSQTQGAGVDIGWPFVNITIAMLFAHTRAFIQLHTVFQCPELTGPYSVVGASISLVWYRSHRMELMTADQHH